MLTKVLSAATN